jgi:hypothetical protein
MKQGQGILPLELLDSMVSKLYDALCLFVVRHLNEAQGSFSHRRNWGREDWVRRIVELLVEIARREAGALGGSGPALSPALISRSAGCVSSLNFILQGILCQISSEI